MIFLDFHYLRVGGSTLGQSLVRYQPFEQSSVELLFPAACDGPVLIFLTLEGWKNWQALAAMEKSWRASPNGVNWMPLEVEDGAGKCPVTRPSVDPLTTIVPVQATTGPAEVIVVTDSAGSSVSSFTRLLPSIETEVSPETLTDSVGRPISTILNTLHFEYTITTLRDSAGRPTATVATDIPIDPSLVTLTGPGGVPTATVEMLTLRDSNGIPTATAEVILSPDDILTGPNGAPTATIGLVTLRDADGRPTATKVLELNSRGRPTATDEFDLVTLKDSRGVPTATVDFELATLRDSNGVPTATVEMELRTLRDAKGIPTATVTSFLGRVTAQSGKVVITDSNGLPVATINADVDNTSIYPEAVTLTDINGNPTATVTGFRQYTTVVQGATQTLQFPSYPTLCPEGYSSTFDCITAQFVHPITQSEYASGYFLPVLFGLVASVLVQMINSELNSILPFHAMTRPGGAKAVDSLCMEVGGIKGQKTSWELLWRFREPLSFLSELLLNLSALVVALSSEAFGIKLYGNCSPDNFAGCFMGLTLYNWPGRAVQVLLIFMLVLVVLICFFSSRWSTGVAASPTSMAVLSSMMQEETCKAVFQHIDIGQTRQRHRLQRLDSELKDYLFILGYFQTAQGAVRYGIIVQPTTPTPAKTMKAPSSKTKPAVSISRNERPIPGTLGEYKPGYRTAVSPLHLSIRAWFLLFICGFLALIVYYKSTRLDTPFERFMDNQNFGVRILFTSMGIIISFFWQYQCSCKISLFFSVYACHYCFAVHLLGIQV
jgi:hypothetical protein